MMAKPRYIDILSSFSAIFKGGEKFCDFKFAFLGRKIQSQTGSTLKMKDCSPMGANSFLLELTAIAKGGKKRNWHSCDG